MGCALVIAYKEAELWCVLGSAVGLASKEAELGCEEHVDGIAGITVALGQRRGALKSLLELIGDGTELVLYGKVTSSKVTLRLTYSFFIGI